MLIFKKNIFLFAFIFITLYCSIKAEYIYLLYGILLCFTLIFFRKKLSIPLAQDTLLPIIIFFIWIYGIIIGLLNQNQISYIFRNFAGLSMYLLFYLLFIYQVKKEKLIGIIYYCSCFFVFYTLLVWILKFYVPRGVYNYVPFNTNFSGGGKNVLFSQELLIFISYGINLYKLIFLNSTIRKKIFNLLIVITAVIDVLLCISLGGYILALVVNTLIVIFVGLYTKFKLSKKNIVLILVSFAFIITFFAYSYLSVGIIEFIFSSEDAGNRVRFEQIVLALKESTFFGNGLGATFATFIRSSEAAYGMEVTPINMIHKFGVLSLILFYSYIKIYFISMKNIFYKKNIELNLFMILSISFIYPSISNPFLYGSVPVLVHTCILYLIYFNKNK